MENEVNSDVRLTDAGLSTCVLIPYKNGVATLVNCLSAILQEFPPDSKRPVEHPLVS